MAVTAATTGGWLLISATWTGIVVDVDLRPPHMKLPLSPTDTEIV